MWKRKISTAADAIDRNRVGIQCNWILRREAENKRVSDERKLYGLMEENKQPPGELKDNVCNRNIGISVQQVGTKTYLEEERSEMETIRSFWEEAKHYAEINRKLMPDEDRKGYRKLRKRNRWLE